MEVMDDGGPTEAGKVLAGAGVAGAASLPAADMGEGVLDCDALAEPGAAGAAGRGAAAGRLAGMRLIVAPGTIVGWPRRIAGPGTRRARVPGAAQHPVQSRAVQQARNLLMDLEDAGMSVKSVPHDRDAGLTAASGAVFHAAGARAIRPAIRAPRMNAVTERRSGSRRRELPDRTLTWNQRHLMTVLRGYEDSGGTHRPHRALNQAAPPCPLPEGVTGLDSFRVRRRDRAGGVIHEYRPVAQGSGTHGGRPLRGRPPSSRRLPDSPAPRKVRPPKARNQAESQLTAPRKSPRPSIAEARGLGRRGPGRGGPGD